MHSETRSEWRQRKKTNHDYAKALYTLWDKVSDMVHDGLQDENMTYDAIEMALYDHREQTLYDFMYNTVLVNLINSEHLSPVGYYKMPKAIVYLYEISGYQLSLERTYQSFDIIPPNLKYLGHIDDMYLDGQPMMHLDDAVHILNEYMYGDYEGNGVGF